MGNPIVPPPPQYERGVACNDCEGRDWPVGSTPKALWGACYGVIACDGFSWSEVNFSMILTQVGGVPCKYLGGELYGFMGYQNVFTAPPGVNFTVFTAEVPTNEDCMIGAETDCDFGGLNVAENCIIGLSGVKGGWSVRTFNMWDFVAVNYNFLPADEGFWEFFSIPDGDPVIRYASIKYSTNVKIQIHPPDVPKDQEGIF